MRNYATIRDLFRDSLDIPESHPGSGIRDRYTIVPDCPDPFNIQLDYDYETNPSSEALNEDITFLMGVGVELD